MEVKQISVFLENRSGQLARICRMIADSDVNLKALNIAETRDYGVLRIITDKPRTTLAILSADGIVCNCTDVVAVRVPDMPGGLADVLEVIAAKGISIEYMYSMLVSGVGSAIMLFQTSESEKVFSEAGLDVLRASDLGIAE